MITKEAIDAHCHECGMLFDYTLTMKLMQEFLGNGLGHVTCPRCETHHEYRFEEGILVSFEQCSAERLLKNRTPEDIIADLTR